MGYLCLPALFFSDLVSCVKLLFSFRDYFLCAVRRLEARATGRLAALFPGVGVEPETCSSQH